MPGLILEILTYLTGEREETARFYEQILPYLE